MGLSARSTSIDFKEKHKTSYCIDTWVRDEQIKVNCKRVKGRITLNTGTFPDTIAVVAFGPSLKHEWEKIKDFKYIMTCSGAHRFLIDKGIIPTWHVEVDPRAHKIKLLGEVHPEVTYLPCSAVHPSYIEHLAKSTDKIELWHSFVTEEEGFRTLPGETGSPLEVVT